MTKQEQALQLLDQLITQAQVVDAISNNTGAAIGENFQVFHLKQLKSLLLEIFLEENSRKLNQDISKYFLES